MWESVKIQDTLSNFGVEQTKGLSEEQARKKLEKYGRNKLDDKKKESIIIKFFKQFNDFMIIILIIAAIVSAVVSSLQGHFDFIDSIIIIGIVVFNAIMGLVQEEKAEKSLEALQNMTAPSATVRRNGRLKVIRSDEIVMGDIIILESGMAIPADCRLIHTSNFRVEESSLTGENIPVEKDANAVISLNAPIGDQINMAFSSGIVVNGHAEAIVVETGMNTKVGKIAGMIIKDESPQTPLQKKLGDVGKKLGIVCLIVCALVFLIGILKRIPTIEMFMTSVGLAVAAIPEGLPAIVTIILSMGVTKMAKKNAIIRKLPAVETLGSASVICSDKTGTLTQNKMEVVRIEDYQGDTTQIKTEELIVQLGAMCTDATIQVENGRKITFGDPTEVAIVNAGLARRQDKDEIYKQMQRIKDIPFDSTRKLMTTIHQVGGKYLIVTKGAPDILIRRCSKVYENGNVSTMNQQNVETIRRNNEKMANDALRVLAIGYKQVDQLPAKIDSDNIENDLTFVGLMGMIDPPRQGVLEAVSTCRKAGIKTVMITGDHLVTARAIASNLGILKKSDLSITGEELDKIPEMEFKRNVMRYSVFARVSPEHKVKIVKAFQSTGAVVAMTGDGVNDAPALKNADIGIAMGKNGTDVAKQAADMVLTDDNFVTIVKAVKQGRNIFANIQKAIHFLLATNIGEIVTIFVGLLIGIKNPLIAIQLLWINLITDSIPAIALGLEPAEKDIMNKAPINSKKGIFADGLWGKIIAEGFMIGLITLVAYGIGYRQGGEIVGRTMAFVCLSMLELIHCFNIKSEKSIFEVGLTENKYLIVAFLLGAALQIGIVLIPPVATIFKVSPLTSAQWGIVAIISLMPILIMEVQKKVNSIKFGKTIYTYNEKTTNI